MMCWTLATGLSFSQTTVAASFNHRVLVQALRLGEPRVAA
jgi:hypothetical protein